MITSPPIFDRRFFKLYRFSPERSGGLRVSTAAGYSPCPIDRRRGARLCDASRALFFFGVAPARPTRFRDAGASCKWGRAADPAMSSPNAMELAVFPQEDAVRSVVNSASICGGCANHDARPLSDNRTARCFQRAATNLRNPCRSGYRGLGLPRPRIALEEQRLAGHGGHHRGLERLGDEERRLGSLAGEEALRIGGDEDHRNLERT